VAVDTILNQRGQGVKCIYVAVGQKGSTVAQTVATLESHGAMEYTVVVNAPARRPGGVQVPGPLRGMRDRPVLDGRRFGGARRLRRPVQASRVVPAAVAAAPPPSRPRGVSGRRVLSPLPVAGTRGQAQRGARLRLAHRAADHRDEGGRHLRLYPDQRDLDHRRADLRRRGPLPGGRAARGRRRHLGLTRGRGRADQGDEVRGRDAQDRPRPVPRPRSVRDVRIRARPACRRPSSIVATGSRSCSSSR